MDHEEILVITDLPRTWIRYNFLPKVTKKAFVTKVARTWRSESSFVIFHNIDLDRFSQMLMSWWHFMTYDDVWWHFMTNMSFIMTCHDKSWNDYIWFREVEKGKHRIDCKQLEVGGNFQCTASEFEGFEQLLRGAFSFSKIHRSPPPGPK